MTKHNHEHHHHTEPQPGDPLRVEIHLHEGALVASYSFSVPGDATETQEKLTNFYHALADMLRDSGAHIGHLKGTATPQGNCSCYSVTAFSVNVHPVRQQGVVLQGVAIVFGISRNELQKLLINAYDFYILGE